MFVYVANFIIIYDEKFGGCSRGMSAITNVIDV